MKVYIYALIDPETKEVRYVGASNKPENRFRQHISDKRLQDDSHKSRWIKGLKAKNIVPEMLILEECSKDNWSEREVYWVASYPNLTNKSKGGEGTNYIHSNETRMKISKSSKGRKHTQATKLKMSQVKKGKTFTEDHKAKLKESAKARASSESMALKSARVHNFLLDGQVISIVNLASYCREKGLSRDGFYDMKKGRRSSYEGYTLL